MRKSTDIFEKICVKTVLLIGAFIFFVFAFWAAKFTHNYPLDLSEERVVGAFDSIPANLLCGLAVVLTAWLVQSLVLRGSEEQKRKRVFWFAVADMVIVGVWLVYWVTTSHIMPDSDQLQVYYDAVAFRSGDYGDMLGYLEMYPQQYGMIFFYEGLLGIWENYRLLQYLNIPFILMILFLSYLIADEIFHNPVVDFYCLAGISCFAPLGYYVNFVYGDVCSAAMCLAAMWGLLRWIGRGGRRYACLAVLSMSIGVLVRKNMLIFILAACIALAVYALRHLKWQALLLALLLAVIPLGSIQAVEMVYEKRSGIEIGDGIPAIMWVAMGMQQSWGGAGVYNGYNNSVFRGEAGSDPEAASRIAKEYIRGRVQEFKQDGNMAYEFYRFKLLEQWNEGSFSCLFMTKHFDAAPGIVVQDAYAGKLQQLFLRYMNRYIFVMYLGVFLFAAGSLFKKVDIMKCLPMIGVIGGVLFSLLWEAKGRYVLPYVVLLFPYMAGGYYALQMGVVKLIRFIFRGKAGTGDDLEGQDGGISAA